MSYHWAISGPSPAPTTYSIVGGQSSLHQERAYLLGALATEESRGEQLTCSLDAARERLAAAEHTEGSTDAVKSLKKTVSGLARKLKRIHKSRKAMISNLAAVTSRMQMLDQHQWRRAQFEYNQRSQLLSLNDMNMNMQNLALVSSITPNYQYQAQSPISPQTPGFAHPVPLTPLQNVQLATTYGDGWGSPLYTPFYAQPYEWHQAANQEQLQIMQYPSHDEVALRRNVEYSGNSGQASESQRLRTMSLPMVQPRASWPRKDSRTSREEDEAISPKSGMNLAKRLSLIGGASSGFRLERLVE
jgi:hypothetical protein